MKKTLFLTVAAMLLAGYLATAKESMLIDPINNNFSDFSTSMKYDDYNKNARAPF